MRNLSRHDHFPRHDADRQRAMRLEAQQIDAGWRAVDQGPGGLLATMASLDQADPDAIFAAMQPWFGDDGWLCRRLDDALAAVVDEPFILPPLRLFHGKGLGGLILAECGAITLSLMIRPGEATDEEGKVSSDSAVFSPGHAMTRFVRAGGATLRRYRVEVSDAEMDGGFTASAAGRCFFQGEQVARDGDVIAVDQARECFSVSGGTGDVVMLQLFVASRCALPLREYDGATGALVRVASSARANSFRQMGFALLRNFGRHDAVPLFSAELGNDDFSLRWQVMREFLALDPAAALPDLRRMAGGDPHPEVRRAATAALDMVESRLAASMKAEDAPCPR